MAQVGYMNLELTVQTGPVYVELTVNHAQSIIEAINTGSMPGNILSKRTQKGASDIQQGSYI